jgi:(E)-4-hydroxy-3-methylbut-2-enyl-diphosphate synthase
MIRRKTRQVMVGNVPIGGDAPISIQSMTNTPTKDIFQTLEQIKRLEKAGAEIIRITVNDIEAANAIKAIKKGMSVPLVADIHFDHKLALMAIAAGIDKLRINPGNIGNEDAIKAVVNAAKAKNIPIRIGVNGGSLEKELLKKYNGVTPEALFESAYNHIKILEALDFHDIIVSIKASSIEKTILAYDLLADHVDYPFHIGVTEAGTKFKGTIKSAIGMGALLLKGYGDTLRTSLTADPVDEIPVCKEILNTLGLRNFGIRFISCPTCGRTQTDMIRMTELIEKETAHINKDMSVAVMGCAVNGPGEAREADLGVACGKNMGLIFQKGEIIKRVSEDEIVDTMVKMIEEF